VPEHRSTNALTQKGQEFLDTAKRILRDENAARFSSPENLRFPFLAPGEHDGPSIA
jgi:DNA-binding transcriptional LysR family regulator